MLTVSSHSGTAPFPDFSTSQPTSMPTPLSADGAQTMDFTCVETQVGNGDPLDCEIVEFDGQDGYYKVQVPAATEQSAVEAKV